MRVCVTRQVLSLSRSSSCLVTSASKPRSDTWAASRGSETPSTITSALTQPHREMSAQRWPTCGDVSKGGPFDGLTTSGQVADYGRRILLGAGIPALLASGKPDRSSGGMGITYGSFIWARELSTPRALKTDGGCVTSAARTMKIWSNLYRCDSCICRFMVASRDSLLVF